MSAVLETLRREDKWLVFAMACALLTIYLITHDDRIYTLLVAVMGGFLGIASGKSSL
jgi:hypothetical protein